MDVTDIATEQEEVARDNALRASRKPHGPTPTGHCLFCTDYVDEGVRWCCVECRDDWEKRSRQERQRYV